MQTRVRISKELAESWTTREVLQASEDHLEDRGGFVGGIAGTEDRWKISSGYVKIAIENDHL